MEKISEELNKALKSKALKGALYSIGIILVLFVVFAAGMAFGFRRASFGAAWQKNYEREFGPAPGGMVVFRSPNAHGAAGRIVKISPPTVIVEDQGNIEKTILIGNDTEIRAQRGILQASDLQTGDFVVVLGNPDQNGQIDASLIRIISQ